MRPNPLLLTTLAGLLSAFPVLAQDNSAANFPDVSQGAPASSAENAEIESMKKEIQALEVKVEALEQQQASQPPSAQIQNLGQQAAAATNATPKISLGADGFKFVSADTNFAMNIRGYMQLDSRTFFQNAATGADGFLLRRVHPIISGTVFHDFDYQFMAEFGGTFPFDLRRVSELSSHAGTAIGGRAVQNARRP